MKITARTAALAAAAGCACSAMASGPQQGQDKIRQANIAGTVAPAYMIYRGHIYPVGSGSHSDTNQLIYENGTIAGSATFYTTSMPNNHIGDEITFYPGPGEGGGRLINAVQFVYGFNQGAPVNTSQPVAVRVRIWDTVNILLGAAVNNWTDQDGDVTFVFNPPNGAWGVNAFYLTPLMDISNLPGGGIQTQDDRVGVDLLFLTTDANNMPTTTINTDMTTLLASFSTAFANTVGSSPAAYWRDVTNDGIFQSGDGNRTFAYPAAANMVLALQSDVAGLVSGACCLVNGTCATISQYECTSQGGVYQGNGTTCGSCPAAPAVLVSNGTLATGTTSGSGVAAPGTSQWSELANDGTVANTTLGFAVGNTAPPAFRIADDFTVPAGGWHVDDIVFYAYQTVSSGTAKSTFNSATLQIWNGPPNAGGTVVFGDTTTNRLASSMFANIYRTGSTTLPAAAPGVVRPVFENWVRVNTNLPAGTYWMDVQFNATLPTAQTVTNAANAPSNTVVGQRTTPGANALQLQAAGWAPTLDTGVAQDFPFVVRGSIGVGSTCYANCDGSTGNPFLTINDFVCFQAKFAAGDSYANCDNSTIAPILTVNDFICFQGKFAAGCSAP